MCRPSLQNKAWKSRCNFVRYLEKIGDIRLDIIFFLHRLINSTSMCDPSGEKSKWWQVRKTPVAAGTLRLSAWPSFNSWSVSSRRGPSAQMGPGHHQKSKVKQLDTCTPGTVSSIVLNENACPADERGAKILFKHPSTTFVSSKT